MTKEEQQVILSAKRWWARKRPLGWTLKQHLAQRTVNCIGAAEQRIGHTVAKLILGAQEPPQPDASQGSAPVVVHAETYDGLWCGAAKGSPSHEEWADVTCVPCLEAGAAKKQTYAERQLVRLAKQVLAPPAAPQGSPLPGVPRGHCDRCDRCGWDVSDERGRCRPKDCSMRPMPPPRTHCAGCGAVFDDVVLPGAPPEGGALEGERKAYLGIETMSGGLIEVEAVHPSRCRCGGMLRQRTGSSTTADPKEILRGPWTCPGCGAATPQSGTVKEGTDGE